MLGGLGLLLARRGEIRDERKVHVTDVAPTRVTTVLANGLNEGHDLDVTDSAADLDDDDVRAQRAKTSYPFLDFVSDVRDDLDGLSQIVAPALFRDHVRVDGSGGRVGHSRQRFIDETFVMAEIEVRLAPIVGDEHLTVLTRIHGARVHV